MKRKLKHKLEQLEKSFSELAKDVAELKQKENALITASEDTKNLEVEFENVETKLEVGKWYFGIDVKILFCFNGKYGNGTHYGFSLRKEWSDNLGVHRSDNYVPAAPSEVEQALIAEAKKRGYNKGVKCKFGDCQRIDTVSSDNFIYNEHNQLLSGKNAIFNNGEWAEIIEETPIKEEDVIDWSKPQLFIGKTTKCVVMSNGKTGIESFEANLVALPEGEISSYYKIPDYFNDCSKKDYELFKGTLTINKE